MPCSKCGHILCIEKQEGDEEVYPPTLFCPQCRGLPIEDDSIVEEKTDWLLNNHLSDKRTISIMREYEKGSIIIYIIWRLNKILLKFKRENGLQFDDFTTLAYILNEVLRESRFGTKTIDNFESPPKEITETISGYQVVLSYIRDITQKFKICVGRFENELEPTGTQFIEDYEFWDTEYALCFDRCARSIIGGRESNREDFNFVADELRRATDVGPNEIESTRDFADCWYQLIMELKFVAATNDVSDRVYYTEMPKGVTIHDIEEFLDRLDKLVYKKRGVPEIPVPLKPSEVEYYGEKIFGSLWENVKRKLIVSTKTLDAHPFLFLFPHSISAPTISGSFSEFSKETVIYPRDFANILKYQLFPLLENEDGKSNHNTLSDLTADRGRSYEHEMYEYVKKKGISCYKSLKITRNNPTEIDLLLIEDGTATFVELKHFMPVTSIRTKEGIAEINDKFDYKIFKENVPGRSGSPSGKPLPTKVAEWNDLNPGERFTSEVHADGEQRKTQTIPGSWDGLDTEILVVSNLVPSYIQKENVTFLTDVEFYKLIERSEQVVPPIAAADNEPA